jgi:hypothetical protein
MVIVKLEQQSSQLTAAKRKASYLGTTEPKYKTKEKTKTFHEEKKQNADGWSRVEPPVGRHRDRENQIRKESWLRIASLPPPGSSLDENMLTVAAP